MTQGPKKLLDQVRDTARLKQYANRAEKTCVYWAKPFVLCHEKRHPLQRVVTHPSYCYFSVGSKSDGSGGGPSYEWSGASDSIASFR